MADHEKCKNCRWAMAYARPDPLPAPVERSILWGLFKWTEGPGEVNKVVHRIRLRRHDKDILCCRFPEAVQKSKDASCGEWAQHLAFPTPATGASHD